MTYYSLNTTVANDGATLGQTIPIDNRDLIPAATEFNLRLKRFHLIEQLNHLCRGVQRHRGLSMGLLGGSEAFAPRFRQLRHQLGRRFELVAALALETEALIPEDNIRSLKYDWETIRDNWQGDSVLENFELHSHFVDRLHRSIHPLADLLEPPFLEVIKSVDEDVDGFAPDDRQAVDALYAELLHFICRKLPPFIELLGKTRALSVHLVSAGKVSVSKVSAGKGGTGKMGIEPVQKLAYLMQCIQREQDAITQKTQHFQQVLGAQMPSLVTVKIHEYKLKLLFDELEAVVAGKSRNRLGSEELFQLASDVIDAYWAAVDDGLGLLQMWQRRDMNRWVLGG